MRPEEFSAHTDAGEVPAWKVLALVAGFIAFWTVYASLSRYNLDLHGDMAENFAWGIGWQLGYYKHPPLFAWISAAWLSIFPRSNFFYHMLSAANLALAVWAMWRISTRFFSASQQLLLVAGAFVLPPLTFLGLNYNATSAMAPFWALTFLSYIRLLERRKGLDAFLLGVFAGLAMLTKYHSAVLILAILVHALYDREVRPLLLTRLTLLASLGGLLMFGPHLWWMVQNDFITVSYAAEQGPGDWVGTLFYAVRFLPAVMVYAAPLVVLLFLQRSWRDGLPLFAIDQWRAIWLRPTGRALFTTALLPALLTMALGVGLDARVSSLWSLPFFVFLPFPLIALLPQELAKRNRRRVPIVVAVYGLVMLMSGPFVRESTLAEGRSNAAMPIEQIANDAERLWREAVGKPLKVVGGEFQLFANGTAFYGPDRPFAIQVNSLALTPWVSPQLVAQDGAAYICRTAPLAVCRQIAIALFGNVDQEIPFTVPAPAGAGGLPNWDLVLLVRRPAG